MVEVRKLDAVLSSILMGVGRWPMSSRETLIGPVARVLLNIAPTSNSAANDIISFNVLYLVRMVPLVVSVDVGVGVGVGVDLIDLDVVLLLKYKCPDPWLRVIYWTR